MSFIDVVDKVINLAKKASMDDEKLHKKHGVELGISLGDSKSNAYLVEARSLSDELKSYLSALPDDVVGKLETVMYFGRDSEDVHGNDIVEYHSRLHPHGINKIDSIRTIVEKRPSLDTYLGEAKRKARVLSLNLNSIP